MTQNKRQILELIAVPERIKPRCEQEDDEHDYPYNCESIAVLLGKTNGNVHTTLQTMVRDELVQTFDARRAVYINHAGVKWNSYDMIVKGYIPYGTYDRVAELVKVQRLEEKRLSAEAFERMMTRFF